MLLPPPPPAWKNILEAALPPGELDVLLARVRRRYQTSTVFPPPQHFWAAFEALPPEFVRVVILGQDPYHGPGQAHGLAFSVPRGQAIPPSLRNILKEYSEDLQAPFPASGDLSAWTREGVLLLNTALTVQAGLPGSHRDLPYATWTRGVLQALQQDPHPKAFWLWGKDAQKAGSGLSSGPHWVHSSAHPSPLGVYRGFWGSKPFSRTDAFFKSMGLPPVNWRLEDVPLGT